MNSHNVLIGSAMIVIGSIFGAWFMAVFPPAPQNTTAVVQSAQAECQPVDQRKFYQQKDGLWKEVHDWESPFAANTRVMTASVDKAGDVHFEISKMLTSDLQLIASRLLRESTARREKEK